MHPLHHDQPSHTNDGLSLHERNDSGIGRRITRFGAILTLSGIFCKILLLIYTVFAIEILGKERFGRIEYFIEMGVIFSVLLDFGLEQTVTREMARRREQLRHFLHPLAVYRLAVSFVGGILIALLLFLTAKPGHTWPLILCTTLYFFVILNMMLIRAMARSLELLSYEGLANALDKIVHIGPAMLVLLYYPRLSPLVLCYTAGAVVSLMIYWYIILRRCGWQRRTYTIREWIDWQKLAIPIGLSAACILLLHREDTAMVNWIRGDEETGLYRGPYRFLEGLFLFPQMLAISAYPIFSKLFHEKRPFTNTAATLMRGLMMLSLPIAVGGTCVANPMMMALAPELGKAGGMVFTILLWSLPFIYANFLLGTILNATDRQNLNVRASFCGLLSNAILNVPGIYFWGAYGASVMTVLSQGLYGVMMMVYMRDFSLFAESRRYLAIVLASSVMAVALLAIPVHWIVAIPFGAMVYFAVLVLFRGVSREDYQNIRRMASKKNAG